MFRPINSDDYTRFRPPAEQVRQVDPSHPGQKRDFAYEIEQINRDKHQEREQQGEPFGEDTFEHTDGKSENEKQSDAANKLHQSNDQPLDGHIDVEI